MIGSTVMINPLTSTVLGFAFPAGLSSAACHEDGRVESGRVLRADRFKSSDLISVDVRLESKEVAGRDIWRELNRDKDKGQESKDLTDMIIRA